MGENGAIISSEHYFTGCLLKDYPFVVNMCNTIGFRGEYFESATAKAIWQISERLFAKGIMVDSASVIENLEVEAKHIDAASASSYMMRAMGLANDPHNLLYHMKIIKEKFRRRNTIEIFNESINLLADNGDVDDIVSRAKHHLSLTENEMSYASESKDDKKTRITERYTNVRSRGTCGIKSRWNPLQEKLASYQFGKLTVLAARPKMGKTSLAVNEAVDKAYQKKIPTAFFSIEMDEDELLEKAACDLTRMDNKKLKLGEYSAEQIKRFVNDGIEPVMNAPLYIIDDPSQTIEQICSRARQLVAEHGVKFIIIDYLQIISSTPGSRFQSRTYEIGSWTNALRILAKETGAAVVVLSQISRPPKGFDQNGDPWKQPMPTMSDLKDSGAIEQDAYAIVLIGPSQCPTPAPSWHDIVPVCVRVEANRGAGTGDFEAMFDKPHNRFMTDLEYEAHRKAIFNQQNAGKVNKV